MGGLKLFKKMGIRTWLHLSDNQDAMQVEQLKKIGIPVQSTYSCSEVGPIAVECTIYSGYYHVAHSNVILEVDESLTAEVDGMILGRVLITHLHSYATPLIRYDVGDFALLKSSCPCGHDGSTLSHIYGRRKNFLKNSDGTFSSFAIFSNPFLDITSRTDFFICQKDWITIVVELGGREAISLQEEKSIQSFIQRLSNKSFNVIVKPVLQIDWTRNPKRLPFINFVD
jgi:phenylacetate-CoA ligase